MKKTSILLLLAVLLSLQSCLMYNPFDNVTTATSATTGTTTTPPKSDPPAAIQYSYSSEWAKQLEGYLSSDGTLMYLLLMNKKVNQFGDSQYVPQNLLSLDSKVTLGGKYIELEARAARALYAMLAEMAHEGITSTRVTSGYRNYERQQELYESYKLQESQKISTEAYEFFGYEYIHNKYILQGVFRLDAEDAEKVANYYSARPGTSEHQTGLCVDFMTLTMTNLDNSFEETDDFQWLAQNAHRFGFILRYPKGKTDITGYIYEPWHFRYVGREAATEIYYRGITLEEYVLGEHA